MTEWGEQRQTATGAPALPSDLPNGWPYAAAEQIIMIRTTGAP